LPKNKPILCLDFDGVCHMYTSGWKGADNIPDPYVPGLFEFLEAAQPYFDIQVFSSRSNQKGGLEAMTAWFVTQRKIWRESGGKPITDEPMSLSFPTEKPPAFIGIDDRVLTFRGEWPDVEELRGFRPWTLDPRGPTNRFPRGKVNEYDEGEIRMAVYHKDGTVFIDFGKKTTWIGLDAKSAREMASLLLSHADQLERASA
jgi:hypothetical protein